MAAAETRQTTVMIRTAKLLDFTRNGDHYTFKIRAQDGDFYQAIQELKTALPLSERWFDPELKVWTVKRTEANRAALQEIFANGAGVILAVESQLTMF